MQCVTRVLHSGVTKRKLLTRVSHAHLGSFHLSVLNPDGVTVYIVLWLITGWQRL